MNTNGPTGWQEIQSEVLRRIQSRTWEPGELIPTETTLCQEFGCSRATVNRALQSLAQAGWLDRKRRAGTRVARHPVRKATLEIPIIRQEIESRGSQYGYRLVSQRWVAAPATIGKQFGLPTGPSLIHVTGIHLADSQPHVLEDRWINPQAIPDPEQIDFSRRSANEWLVEQIPAKAGKIAFTAASANLRQARWLQCRSGDSLFVVERRTWNRDRVITFVRLYYPPGYRLTTDL